MVGGFSFAFVTNLAFGGGFAIVTGMDGVLVEGVLHDSGKALCPIKWEVWESAAHIGKFCRHVDEGQGRGKGGGVDLGVADVEGLANGVGDFGGLICLELEQAPGWSGWSAASSWRKNHPIDCAHRP